MINYIKKHWYGDQSLAKSFWINNILVTVTLLVLYGLAIFLGYLPGDIQITAKTYVISTLFLLFFTYAILPWQTVGLWRSSRRYINERPKRYWGYTVQIITLFGLVYTLWSLPSDLPKIKQFVQLSYKLGFTDTVENDPIFSKKSLYHYELNLSTDNKTLQITGVFKPGIAKEVEVLLKENPFIETIVLDSPGGSQTEGKKLAELIEKNELNTIATNECSSACTDAFIAGKNRAVNKDAKLGFHKATIIGEELNDFVFEEIFKKDIEKRFIPFCQKQGISENFIDAFKEKVLNSKGNEMWYPTIEEMLGMHLIHEVIINSQ